MPLRHVRYQLIDEDDLVYVERQDGDYQAGGMLAGELLNLAHPKNIRWDDLQSSASTINPPGTTGVPEKLATGELAFDSVGVEQIVVTHQLEHGWREGSEIRPHVHWGKSDTNTGDVVWQMRYRILSTNQVPGAWTDWLDIVGSSSALDDTTKMLIDYWAPIDMGGFGISTLVIYQIRRDPTNGSDDYGSDAYLYSFDTHIQKDAAGSLQEYVK